MIALVIALVVRAGDAEPETTELEQLRGQVYDDAEELERDGIFVSMARIEERGGRRCVEVSLLNPTAPNRAWVSDRYGPHVCVSREPIGGYPQTDMACPGPGPVAAVPDVTGLSLDAARRRLHAAGFRLNCNTGFNRPPSRFSPDHALIVEETCVDEAPRGAMVELQLGGILPGGFRYVGVGDTCGD